MIASSDLVRILENRQFTQSVPNVSQYLRGNPIRLTNFVRDDQFTSSDADAASVSRPPLDRMSRNPQNYRLWVGDRNPETSNRIELRHGYLNRTSTGRQNSVDLVVELLHHLVAANESEH
jgi:hypothetical protein